MLVRHQRALTGYAGGIILTTAFIYGILNMGNLMAVIFSTVGVVMALAAGWYAFKR